MPSPRSRASTSCWSVRPIFRSSWGCHSTTSATSMSERSIKSRQPPQSAASPPGCISSRPRWTRTSSSRRGSSFSPCRGVPGRRPGSRTACRGSSANDGRCADQSRTRYRQASATRPLGRGHHGAGSTAASGALVLGQTGFGVIGEVGTNTLFWRRSGSNDQVLSTTYEARATGDEIVICMSNETVYRTLATDPKYEDEFRASVRNWLLARLRAAVSDPDALPPEADNFREVRPFAYLDDAADEARRTGRRILAFVYDPNQKERGR